MKQLILFTILGFFSFNKVCLSQTLSDATYQRPKIGLVLSGGGAKGIAHIGVLKILEEYGIRPDYITGTSMGSIMGGLYASGYSAKELDSIVRRIDWNIMLSDNISLSKVVPEEKADYGHFLVEFDLTKKGPVLPKGMVVGQGITEELNYLTWHVSDIDNFDDLPIPFRCVASDLISGEPYVFDCGNLALAMRASMAIPSAFSPVPYNNMLLVDGGVLDNLPVQVCKDMGADIIIAVNVGLGKLPKAEDFKSIADVLMGSAMIRSNSETLRALKDIDILIQPDLEGYTAASFSNGPEIIQLGENAALQHLDEIEELAAFMKQFPAVEEFENPKKQNELYIEDIEVENLKHLNKNFVIGKFGIQKGHVYTRKQIEDGLHLLIGTRYIDNVKYELEKGQEGYIIILTPTESYPSNYNFSIHYNSTYKASAIFNLTFRNYVFKGSSFKTTIDVSEYPQLSLEVLDHYGKKQNFGGKVNFHWEKNSVPYIDDSGNDLGDTKQHFFEAQAGLFYTPNISRILTGGFYFDRLVSNTNSGVLSLLIEDVGKIGNVNWGLMLDYNKNSLNEHFFPTRGMLFNFHCNYPFNTSEIYNGSEAAYDSIKSYIGIPNKQYLKIFTSIKQYIPMSEKWNFYYSASLGISSKEMGQLENFNLGGVEEFARQTDIPLIGLLNKELSTQQFMMAGVNFRFSPINKLYLTVSSYLLEYKTEFEEFNLNISDYMNSSELIQCFGLRVAYQSFLGPIQLGYGRNTLYNKDRFYFSVGFPF